MFFFCLLVVVLLAAVRAENNDVVVLVHGFNSNEGTWDYADEIRQAGFTVITLNIPPTASNHDRAVSLFAQLKGTRMDFGVCHSEQFGIDRFGEDFTGRGLFPEWDSNNKAHFIGHSMGGQTIRALERFLELGSGCPRDTDFLFQGGNDWITSITTLATPHDGTTGIDINPFTRGEHFVNAFISRGGKVDDLALPHMGLVRGENESRQSFLNRLYENFSSQENNAIFDLSTEGAALFNSNGPAVVNPNRYYMAYANERTSPQEVCRFFFFCEIFEVADPGMTFQLKIAANILGRDNNPADRANDGAVNQDRSKCPGDNSQCLEVPDDITTWSPGQWHFIKIGYLDHFQMTGRDRENDENNFIESTLRMYLQIASRLKALPSTSVSRLSPKQELEARLKADEVNSYLEAQAFFANLPEPEGEGSNAGAIVLTVFVFGTLIAATVLATKYYKKRANAQSLQDGDEGAILQQTL